MNTKIFKIVTNSSNNNDNKKTSKLSRFRSHSHIVQNFVLVWLDPNIDGKLNDEHREIVNQVRSIISNVKIYSDVDKCTTFLDRIKSEKVFMIVSGALGQHALPRIHHIPKLDSIYVFCGLKSQHEKWAQKWTKIKGVSTQITPICDSLKQTIQKFEQNFLSLSFVTPSNVSDQNLDQLDQSFMYTKILKEILLEIKYNDQSVKDFVCYCNEQHGNNEEELDFIKNFAEDYRKHSPVYWYTHPGFIHSMVNQALRTHEVDTIIKMGFFIQDLHEEISKLHTKQVNNHDKQSFVVYRGQGLSMEEFENLLKAKGGLMSFNSFLSTSKNREVSLEFAQDTLNDLELVGVLFKMVIDPSELATPYAFIVDDSYFKNEEEVLFSMHTVFRIGEIKQIQKTNRLYQVILTLTNSRNKQLSALTELFRDETRGSTGWHRLGMLLIKLGKFDKAEQVYRAVFSLNADDNEKALLCHQLGLIKRNQGKYSEALSLYKQTLDIYQKIRSSHDLDLATTYNNIGQVYYNMGDYTEALSYYEKSLEIYKQNLSEDHPTLAIFYNNIGLVYKNMGDYTRALKSHQKALEIEENMLPINHPTLATSYKNIGLIYYNLGEYTKALSFHEKARDIEQKTLPANHPSLAISYNNMGLVYDNMGEYSKVLSFYEKALAIYQGIFSENHPDFAMCYNNIGSVYKNMGEYSKALVFYKKALDIEEKILTSNHPSLAISYSNIGNVYDCIGEHTAALSSHEKALEICKKTLPSKHRILAMCYNNIGSVYDNMGDYKTALTYYKNSLEIEQEILPSNHPDLATSYNNIGLVYDNLDEYMEALVSHQKALEIYEKSLPPNHLNLANSYNNIGLAHQKTHEYSKALVFYQKALEIRQKILPSNHVDLIVCYANISKLYEIMGEYSQALSYYEQFVQARDNKVSSDHSTSADTYINIDRITDRKEEALETHLPSKSIRTINKEKLYGKLPCRTTLRKKSIIVKQEVVIFNCK
ncbi:unnamed protein product [Rotaria magnacalcarata]|uniref:ADP ribosyltransferase domain-containing protein n=4 Tax=Rotaria magnacalcarata TaxID=392030 RepID=A0A814KXI8_9BILA|nr:unnamed protein product [Rotaria magnacalcarata]CAF1334700.1 unnamed protein product [Rotaria magnacalcarata]